MEAKIEILTLGELKKQLKALEEMPDVTDETKIFLDTGWDSIQELAPDALSFYQLSPPPQKSRFFLFFFGL
ncbi:hypothetical protein K4E_25920 [Enterococcus thailandicus]|nr:hypothetical protein K4E_25920 [Enterococcus thailandicus]